MEDLAAREERAMRLFRMEKTDNGGFVFFEATDDDNHQPIAISYIWGPPPYVQYALPTPSYPYVEVLGDTIVEDLLTNAIRRCLRLISIWCSAILPRITLPSSPYYDLESLPTSYTPIPSTSPSNNLDLSIRLSRSFWSIDSFFDNLWDATNGQPFWLDQISLPQDKSLAIQLYNKIPEIYSTFPVRILSNSTPCPLVLKVDTLSLETLTEEEVHDLWMTVYENHINCQHCGQINGWLNRLWPRQEAHYATNLQLVHLSSSVSSSSNDTPPLNNSTQRDYFFSEDDRDSSLLFMIAGKIPSHDEDSRQKLEVTAKIMNIKFIRGDVLLFQHEARFQPHILGSNWFSASDQRDMVLAVWTLLKGYEIPKDAKNQKPIELYRDACRQYRQITGRHIPVPYLQRFAEAAGLPLNPLAVDPPTPLIPYVISPLTDDLDTISWYSQWSNPDSCELDSKGRMLGRLIDLDIHLFRMEDFPEIYTPIFQQAGILRSQTNVTAARHVLGARFKSILDRYISELDCALAHLYAIISYDPEEEDLVTKYRPTFELLETLEKNRMGSLRNLLRDPVGFIRARFFKYWYLENRKNVWINAITIFALLHLGLPIHTYKNHRSMIRFWKYEDKLVPALCIDDTREMRLLLPLEGRPLIAHMVTRNPHWTGTSEGTEWIVVGMTPMIKSLMDIPSTKCTCG